MPPSSAARASSGFRLVTRTALVGVPGRSGRTWPRPWASSRTSRMLRVARRERKSAARASPSSGIACESTPDARSSSTSTSSAWRGWSDAPRRRTNHCPSGKRSVSSRATRTATAVLPTPGVPERATIRTPSVAVSRSTTSVMRSSRPTRLRMSSGSWFWCCHSPSSADVRIDWRSARSSSLGSSPNSSTSRRANPSYVDNASAWRPQR